MSALPPRPTDATLSVTKAARLLGVHPNTVRAWSDAGRLRYYRINPRGDRRYRLGDLQRFLAAAESAPADRGAGDARRIAPLASTRPSWPRRRRRHEARRSLPTTRLVQTAATRVAVERHRRDLAARSTPSPAPRLSRRGPRRRPRADAVQAIRDAFDHALVAVWELRGDRLVARLPSAAGRAGSAPARPPRALRDPRPGASTRCRPTGPGGASPTACRRRRCWPRRRTASPCAILPGGRPSSRSPSPGRRAVGRAAHRRRRRRRARLAWTSTWPASSPTPSARSSTSADAQDEVAHLLHRAEALRRVAGDIGSRLDLDRILTGLVDHAMVLFEGDRAAVFLRRPDGHDHGRGQPRPVGRLSRRRPGRTRRGPCRSRPSPRAGRSSRSAIATTRAARTSAPPSSRRASTRSARRRCIDGTSCSACSTSTTTPPHAWTPDELETIAALATQASVAIRTAQNFQQMATWAAQLQSIQQLGARLNRLSSVRDIGLAIATELRQLIDYHNVRVYRLVGDGPHPGRDAGPGRRVRRRDAGPAAGRGRRGHHRLGGRAPRRPEPARRRRATRGPTRSRGPRTTSTSRCSSRRCSSRTTSSASSCSPSSASHQFTDDDLRLLVIYASFAAQAMANADTTERLREQSASARAPGPQPARAAPDHRVDPDHARRARRCSRASPSGSAA